MKLRAHLVYLFLLLILILFTDEPSQQTALVRQEKSHQDLFQKVRAFPIASAPLAPSGQAIPITSTNGLAQQFQALTNWGQNTSGVSKSSSITAKFKNESQAQAFHDLAERFGNNTTIFLRPESKTPMQIKGFNYRSHATSAEATAADFLNDYHHLLLSENGDVEWRVSAIERDHLGRTNVRFSQMYEGLEVFPAELSVHVSNEGAVDLLDGVFIPTPQLSTLIPKLDISEAIAKGSQTIPAGHRGKVSNAGLVIHAPIQGEPKLAWKFDLEVGLMQNWLVLVDALSGDVLKQFNRTCTANVPGSGTDLGGVTRPLNLWFENGTYYLIDASKPMFNLTKQTGLILILDAQNANVSQLDQGAPIVIPSASGPNSWNNPSAVSAAYNLSVVYDYYLEIHQRNSFNNRGSNIQAVVNIGGMENAAWNSTVGTMYFGAVGPFAKALDVVGHEVTHGVASSIGEKGVLNYEFQSGALNEAFADIFGEMIENYGQSTNDWILGSALRTELQRDMIDPTRRDQPGKASQFRNLTLAQDHGGVHVNSGIINRAFYLLAEGMPESIGKGKASQIFYRCLTQHMKPLSQFVDARLGCITAAETLFGVDSLEAIKTVEAFDSVEIYAYPISAEAPRRDLPTVSGADSTLFVYYNTSTANYSVGRRESAQGDAALGRFLRSNAKVSKLSVSADGTEAAHVTSDHRLTLFSTLTGQFSYQSDPIVHATAISPNGKYAAVVLRTLGGAVTNQILILDLVNGTVETNTLEAVSFDGASIDRILYADTMDFSPDGSLLIYDTVSTRRNANGSLGSAWSIYALDMETRRQKLILPSVDGLSFGNPSFSHTSSRYITFEAQGGNGNAAVFTADLVEGRVAHHATTFQTTAYPVFSPDDGSILYADYDAFSYSLSSMYRLTLGADRLTSAGSPSFWLQGPALGTLYRRVTPAGLNKPPTITITSPTSDTVLESPGTLTISCNAADLDGSIQRVELFLGSKAIATNAVSPFSFTANGLPAGNYPLYLRAYDNLGASTTSSPVNLKVQPPGGKARLVQNGQKQFEMKFMISASGAYRVETSTNLVDWVSVGTVYSSSGILNFSDLTATNHSKRFYRAVKLE